MAKSTQVSNVSNKSDSSDKLPQVVKVTEYELMLELIEAGLWRSGNLATALHVNIDTITAWKKRPEAIEAHRKTILKFSKQRSDVDGILKEMEIETQQRVEESNVRVTIEDYGSKNNPATQTEGSDRSE